MVLRRYFFYFAVFLGCSPTISFALNQITADHPIHKIPSYKSFFPSCVCEKGSWQYAIKKFWKDIPNKKGEDLTLFCMGFMSSMNKFAEENPFIKLNMEFQKEFTKSTNVEER